MPNFSIEVISPRERILTDAIGRRILLHSNSDSQGSFKDIDLAVKVPLSRTVACTPIQLSFALRLDREVGGGVVDKFIGILNGAEAHLVLPELIDRLRNGKISDIKNIAELRSTNPEISFAFLWTRKDPQLVNIFEHIKAPYVVTDAWYEPTLTDRIQWLEFIGHFFNVQDKAQQLVTTISERIKTVSEVARRSTFHPEVLWFVDFQDYVFVTGGKSWVAQAVRDLGGNVLTPSPDSSGSVESSRQWVSEHLNDADVIVFTMVRPTVAHISKIYPEIVESKAYKNRRIFGFSLEYWQESAYAPELWFEELSRIIHPAEIKEGLKVFAAARM